MAKVNYNKRPRGMSKREYLASVSGGSLNYNSGKVSIKSASKPKSSGTKNTYTVQKPGMFPIVYGSAPQPSSAEEIARVTAYQKQAKQNVYDTAVEENNKKLSKKSSSSSKNRSAASKLFAPSAEAATRDVGAAPTLQESTVKYTPRWYQVLQDPLGIRPKARKVAAQFGIDNLYGGAPELRLSELLGINPAKKSGLANYVDDQGKVLGVSDANIAYNYDTSPVDKTSPDSWDRYYTAAKQDQQNRTNDPIIQNINNRLESGESADSVATSLGAVSNRPEPRAVNAVNLSESLSPEQLAIQSAFSDSMNQGTAQDTVIPDTTPVQPDRGATVRKLASSGAFGNGALASNNGSLDPATQEYINQLKGSLKGDYGMKDAKKQLENLLNSINLQYDESQRTGTNELNNAKAEDLNKIMSLFGAYNTADSEQRMQTQERTQNDYQSRLADFLAKLDAQRGQDVLSAKNKGLDMFSDINKTKQSAQQKVADLIYQLKQSAYDRAQKNVTAGRVSTATNTQDKQFEDTAKSLAMRIKQGGMTREEAASYMRNYFPNYDENVIYDLVPDFSV